MSNKEFKIPKLVLSDIDGVWTDGGMYYDQKGNEQKKFHTYDSAGVLLCKNFNIPVGIITGENTKIVENRINKLNIEFLYQGISNKVEIAIKLCKKLNINLEDIAYIGDDINDLHLLKKVGISAAPSNAPDYVKKEVDFVMNKAGGEGVFREFVEFIFEKNNLFQDIYKAYKI